MSFWQTKTGSLIDSLVVSSVCLVILWLTNWNPAVILLVFGLASFEFYLGTKHPQTVTTITIHYENNLHEQGITDQGTG
jgi:hypothetical protein